MQMQKTIDELLTRHAAALDTRAILIDHDLVRAEREGELVVVLLGQAVQHPQRLLLDRRQPVDARSSAFRLRGCIRHRRWGCETVLFVLVRQGKPLTGWRAVIQVV